MIKQYLAVALTAVSLSAFADPLESLAQPQGNAALDKVIKPYLVVGNYKEDSKRVFMFFSYTCPFCNQMWGGMDAWAKTLLPDWRYVQVPYITQEKSSKVAATAFYIVRELAPHRLAEFNRMAYAVGQTDAGRNGASYIAILRKMGFKEEQIRQAAMSPVTQKRLERAMILTLRYNIRRTPMMAVGGRYTTHLDFTGGDPMLLGQLLSALVSMSIEGEKP